MATHSVHRIHPRLRIDDDGTAAVEFTIQTGTGDDVVAEWEVEYLPSEAQTRIRAALADVDGNEPPLDVSTNKPDTRPGTHPQG